MHKIRNIIRNIRSSSRQNSENCIAFVWFSLTETWHHYPNILQHNSQLTWEKSNNILRELQAIATCICPAPSPFTAERAGQGCLGYVLDEARHTQGVRARHGNRLDQNGEAYWAFNVRQGEVLQRNLVSERHLLPPNPIPERGVSSFRESRSLLVCFDSLAFAAR